jgi:hypothetical protein
MSDHYYDCNEWECPLPVRKNTPGKYVIRKIYPIEYDTKAQALNVAKDYAGGLDEWKVVRVKDRSRAKGGPTRTIGYSVQYKDSEGFQSIGGKYATFNGWRDVREVWSLETARAIAEHWNSKWSDRCAVVVRHFRRC